MQRTDYSGMANWGALNCMLKIHESLTGTNFKSTLSKQTQTTHVTTQLDTFGKILKRSNDKSYCKKNKKNKKNL